jgi:hypothetical protein
MSFVLYKIGNLRWELAIYFFYDMQQPVVVFG